MVLLLVFIISVSFLVWVKLIVGVISGSVVF